MWRRPGVTEQGPTEMKDKEKKPVKLSMPELLCAQQRHICEYERFCGDLLIMLVKGEHHPVIQHVGVWNGDFIWDECVKLIEENKRLKEKLALFSQGNEKTVN